MDRRKSLQILVTGAAAATAAAAGCNTNPANNAPSTAVPNFNLDRAKEEIERDTKLLQQKFFDAHEMATITTLADIIIPKDAVSGSASDAKVPEFISFIVIDMPHHQVPMRGGLRWLDMACLKNYNQPFINCTSAQQIQMVDAIAYPKKAKPENAQGVAFFSLMRNLTASGFYTSQIGVKDVGYQGNTPNQWNGVPPDVLAQYKLAYTDKELKECVNFDAKATT
jgi:gluconate 2-dehydrogenase gamma chain